MPSSHRRPQVSLKHSTQRPLDAQDNGLAPSGQTHRTPYALWSTSPSSVHSQHWTHCDVHHTTHRALRSSTPSSTAPRWKRKWMIGTWRDAPSVCAHWAACAPCLPPRPLLLPRALLLLLQACHMQLQGTSVDSDSYSPRCAYVSLAVLADGWAGTFFMPGSSHTLHAGQMFHAGQAPVAVQTRPPRFLMPRSVPGQLQCRVQCRPRPPCFCLHSLPRSLPSHMLRTVLHQQPLCVSTCVLGRAVAQPKQGTPEKRGSPAPSRS